MGISYYTLDLLVILNTVIKQMLSRASINGNRVHVSYWLDGPWPVGQKKRTKRDGVNFWVKPSTKELNIWLAKHGWAPQKPRYCNGGRAIDFYVRRYWWHFIDFRKFPPKRWSTLQIINEMLRMIKDEEHLHIWPSTELLNKPNRGRLIDYLAKFWYIYEGGKKKSL